MTLSVLRICLLILLMADVYGQQTIYLTKGKTVRAPIAVGEKHRYTVKLGKDQFALLTLMQKGVDVQMTTYDAQGHKLQDFDSPNGDNGPESAEIRSMAQGDYFLEVLALGGNGEQPVYELTLALLQPKAVTPTGRMDELLAPYANSTSPGAAVAVIKNGKLMYAKGYGMANLEHAVALTENTLLPVGSVTKSFTNYCILLLEKQGRLSLEDDIRKYVPEVPEFGQQITLRHLAEHSSGLRDYATLRGMARYEIDTREMFFKMLGRQHNLNFAPGDDCDYSNTGCVLLAEVIERISGQNYAAFVKEHIFDPLRMRSSLIQEDQSLVIPGIADSYERSAHGPKKLYALGSLVGSTGVVSNATDMARWAAHLLNPQFNADIIRKMSSPGTLKDGTRTVFGPGLMIGEHQGHLEIGHSGATGGFKAHVGIFPADDLAVIVLSNANDIYSRPVARQIAELFFEPKGKASAIEGLITAAPAKSPRSTATESPFPNTSDLSEYTGIFFSDEVPTLYWLKVVNGQLVVEPSYLSDMKLTPIGRDTFSGVWDGTVAFVRNSEGSITGCKFSFSRMKSISFKKIANY